MARHRQKDEEAGGEGLGVIESRKKLWRDAEGNIVNKRPAQGEACRVSAKKQATDGNYPHHTGSTITTEGCNPQTMIDAEPLSPPKSMLSAESLDHFSHQLPELPDDQDFIDHTAGPDMFDFLANSSWGSHTSSSLGIPGEMPMDDMFNPDTGKSKAQDIACILADQFISELFQHAIYDNEQLQLVIRHIRYYPDFSTAFTKLQCNARCSRTNTRSSIRGFTVSNNLTTSNRPV